MEVQRLLTHPNPDKLCQFFEGEELRDIFVQLMWVLRAIQNCAGQKGPLDEDVLARLDQHTKRLYQLWRWLDTLIPKNVTPKVHMLCAHLPSFARTRGWFSAVSEQAIEHLHSRFNRLAKFLSFFQIFQKFRNHAS